MNNHTFGPWEIITDESGMYIAGPLGYEDEPDNRRVVIDICDGEHLQWLAEHPEYSDPEEMANYNLMAAAPDLLEALRALHKYHYRPDTQDLPVNDRIKELDRIARAAIQKAEGAQ